MWVNWSVPLRNGGIFNCTCHGIKYSAISDPLSAIMESPASNKYKIPDCHVNSLSDTYCTEPENSLEMNVMAPLGDIPIRAL